MNRDPRSSDLTSPPPPANRPGGGVGLTPILRGLVWGLLLAAMALLVIAAFLRRGGGPPVEPPPVLYQLPAFELTNRDGRIITLDDLAGAPWIASFVFTRCAGPCPLITQRMSRLGERLPDGARRVSLSVDPETDTPAVLDDYAGRFGAPPDWLFLTGTRQEIWELSIDGFKLGVSEAGENGGENGGEHGAIAHSTRFALVDGQGRVRAYYDALYEDELGRLESDYLSLLGE